MARVIIPGFRKIESGGSGEGGTNNYNDLTNKPSINNVPLVGNLNTANLKLTDATLTEEGVPAEAKTVGDKLKEHSTSLTTLKKETTVNILKPTLATTTQNGVTCTNNGDGTYTIDTGGSPATANCYFILDINFNLESGKIYRMIGNPGKPNGGSSGSDYRLEFYNGSEYFGEYGGGTTVTGGIPNKIQILITEGVTVSNLIFKPMITTNLNATYDDFVPYTGSTGKINSDVASLLKRIEALESLTNKTDTTTVESE